MPDMTEKRKHTYDKKAMAKYGKSLKEKGFTKATVIVPSECKADVLRFAEDLRVVGTWDRRAKAECKAFGSPTRFYYHARNASGSDLFLDTGDKSDNRGWGLFPSLDSVKTAWNGLTDDQKEAIANERL